MAAREGAESPPAGEDGTEAERFLPNRLSIHRSAWIAPGAVLVGDIEVGAQASIWYGCVLRGDLEPIRVGRGTNIQDLTIVHVDRAQPVAIGSRVTVGHRSVIHGCTIEDEALIGMGAVLLSGCRIGRGALVAAGAVVREAFEVPAGAVVAGVPASVRGQVDEPLRERARRGVDTYIRLASSYRDGMLGG